MIEVKACRTDGLYWHCTYIDPDTRIVTFLGKYRTLRKLNKHCKQVFGKNKYEIYYKR